MFDVQSEGMEPLLAFSDVFPQQLLGLLPCGIANGRSRYEPIATTARKWMNCAGLA